MTNNIRHDTSDSPNHTGMTTDVLYHPEMGVITDYTYRDSVIIIDDDGPCYINTWVLTGCDVWATYGTTMLK